ncbi:MAG: SPFH domain-containing protein, partial [Candidatus Omnitrophica bacterium]|nr:SPFH domain-containing protein [Candidatus Omnitrophota bacterium]
MSDFLIILAVPVIVVLLTGVRIIQQYQTSVVFQLGRYSRTLKPGFNVIIPLVEWTKTVDMRTLTRDIPRQQMITKDNVPVTINGVVYFRVTDAKTAIIEVQDYNYAVSQFAQAALRDMVGGVSFDDLLAERQKIGEEIEKIVTKEISQWGLTVSAIKIQDVDVPEELKKMMSRQASAE